jgi:hypothetical protein
MVIKSGHFPGHIREGFQDVLDEHREGDWDQPQVGPRVRRYIGFLWNCTDIMPSWCSEILGLQGGGTYAMGVRRIHREWKDL